MVSYTNGPNVLIESCFVDGGSIYAGGYTGGLIGNLRGTATVKNCYAIMDSIYTSQYRSSGLIGIIVGDTHNVKDCYAVTKSLDCIDKNEIYGFTYSTTNPTVNNCYWDKEISGVTGSSFGLGLTTAEMKSQSTYTDWDFENIWGINGDYPYLQIFGVPSAPAKKETVTVNTYVNKITGDLTKQIRSTQQLQSYISTIQANTERHTATIRSVEGYLSRINSNVTQSHRSVRTGNRNVDSFVLPIGTSVYRESKTIKQLLSYVRPLQARVSVLYPLRDIPIHATVSTLKNPSVSSQNENMSNISYIQNPSNVEVI